MTKIFDIKSQQYIEAQELTAIEAIMKAKAEKGRWDAIDMVIAWYAKKFETQRDPSTGMTYNQYIKNNLETRKQLLGKTGRGKAKLGRFIISMPEKIMFMIHKLYPDIFKQGMKDQQKYFRSFAQRYKQFQVPERI